MREVTLIKNPEKRLHKLQHSQMQRILENDLDRSMVNLITHFEPSELTEPSLESFDPCFVSLGLFAGITSVLRCTPLVNVRLPPRRKSKNNGHGVQ